MHAIRIPILTYLALACIGLPEHALAHGGVVEDDDLCVINIGYLKAHFKIYVPRERQHEEYCEDIPIKGESIFVMEYQHDDLNLSEIDFRIIENVTGRGKFARLEDVMAIDDIDAVTLRYESATVVPDVFTLLQTFEENGEYIGIVSATHANTRKTYKAVFPFEVGYTGAGYWPWFIAALLLLQGNYWLMSRRKAGQTAKAVLLCCLYCPLVSVAEETPAPTWISDAQYFSVNFESDLPTLSINVIHRWILQVKTKNGEAVTQAKIEIAGGMPAHNHGLPTEPKVVEELPGGRYRIDGMRFHMQGSWEVQISIDDGAVRDSVTISLEL